DRCRWRAANVDQPGGWLIPHQVGESVEQAARHLIDERFRHRVATEQQTVDADGLVVLVLTAIGPLRNDGRLEVRKPRSQSIDGILTEWQHPHTTLRSHVVERA